MADLPRGIVTFLFTDIQGSTRLWQQFPQSMPAALARHHAILSKAIEEHDGYVFQVIGDAFCAAFEQACAALQAAIHAQRALRDALWPETDPILVRMALMTGEASVRAGEFKFGEYASSLVLSRASRLLAASHGGQILVSAATRELLLRCLPPDAALEDLGEHRLRDIITHERIYQAVTADLPKIEAVLRTEDLPSGNLPHFLTSFVGRERELSEIIRFLSLSRMVTLTGPGGCGKTRLAVETGHRQKQHYRDGVWLVDFSQISDEHQVIPAIARTLGVIAEGEQPLEAVLAGYLKHRVLLLILDNCEHVADEAARAVETILSAGPTGLQILVTSQVPLGVHGEIEWLIPSLDLPETGQEPLEVAALLTFSAPRLFLERAAEVVPGFVLQAGQIPTLLEICRCLDGIPLAIELAAARAKMLAIEQIAARLSDRFALLSTSRHVASRYQTLQAAIDWSYKLLKQQQQTLLNRCAVFAGPWTIEAAEAVCGYGDIPPAAVLELLSELVDRSLVVVIYSKGGENQAASETRYRLLESIRLYGLSKLTQEELVALREQHLKWYTGAARLADQHIHGHQQVEWIDRLEADLPNHLAAIEWAAGFTAPHTCLLMGLELAAALSWYARGRSPGTIVHNRIEQLLDQAGETSGPAWIAARAAAHYSLGRYDWLRTHILAARDHQLTSLKLWSTLGAAGETGYALAACHLANTIPFTETEKRIALTQEALALFTRLGNEWGQAEALFHWGMALLDKGEVEQGKSMYDQALNLFRKVGDRQYQGFVHLNLGSYYLYDRGKYTEALAHFQEADHLLGEIRFPHGRSLNLEKQGDILLSQGQLTQAEEIYWQILPIAEQTGLSTEIAFAYQRIGQIRLHEQRYADARRCFLFCLQTVREDYKQELTDERNQDWRVLFGLAASISVQNPEHAARLHGKALAEFKRREFIMYPIDVVPADKILDTVKNQIGAPRYHAAQVEGERLSLDELLASLPDENMVQPVSKPVPASAVEVPQPSQPPSGRTPLQAEKDRFSGITAREREVAAWIVQGATNAAIAKKLQLSERTVTTHVSHILNKLGYSSRSQIAAWAVEKGLVKLP